LLLRADQLGLAKLDQFAAALVILQRPFEQQLAALHAGNDSFQFGDRRFEGRFLGSRTGSGHDEEWPKTESLAETASLGHPVDGSAGKNEINRLSLRNCRRVIALCMIFWHDPCIPCKRGLSIPRPGNLGRWQSSTRESLPQATSGAARLLFFTSLTLGGVGYDQFSQC